MGRTTGGVEVREASIRLSFTAVGVRYRHTLMLEGEAMLPTPANVKYAHRLIAEIRACVKTGAFRMADYFPDAEPSAPTQDASTETPPTKAPRTIKPAKPTQPETSQPLPSTAPPKRRQANKLTVEAWLTQWRGMSSIETSTRIGYDAAIKF
jgi:integrase